MAEPEQRDVRAAVEILRGGGLVAFPTETVYGLGADARSSAAVKKIFAAKGRPATNPVIVHVADVDVARRFASKWPTKARQLAQAFWPGALTLVVPKSPEIVGEVTAGGATVGLRVPNHPVALELLREFGGPVAAPSANRSERISPTTAEHVRNGLGSLVDLILDGGPCRVGIESTVLSLVDEDRPIILRPGGVQRKEIEAIIGPVRVVTEAIADGPAQSPGMQAVHYSPTTPTYRFERDQAEAVTSWCRSGPHKQIVELTYIDATTAGPLQNAAGSRLKAIMMPSDPDQYAQKLYAVLHAADQAKPDCILIEMPPDLPEWMAVRDRLMRASIAIK